MWKSRGLAQIEDLRFRCRDEIAQLPTATVAPNAAEVYSHQRLGVKRGDILVTRKALHVKRQDSGDRVNIHHRDDPGAMSGFTTNAVAQAGANFAIIGLRRGGARLFDSPFEQSTMKLVRFDP
jgi:hypothetical protein